MMLFEICFIVGIILFILSVITLLVFKLYFYLILELGFILAFFIWSHFREKKRKRDHPIYADWHDEQMKQGRGRWDHIGYGSGVNKDL